MSCKCGGQLTTRSSVVKTAKGLVSWHDAPFDKDRAPFSVTHSLCTICGRNSEIIVVDSQGEELLPRWPEKYKVQEELF